jgi:hypothetical protein
MTLEVPQTGDAPDVQLHYKHQEYSGGAGIETLGAP